METLFLRAIRVARRVARLGPSKAGRPSPETRLALYGLYKQATEGDVEGVLARPEDPSDSMGLKWDAWYEQRGKSREDAQLQYIQLLLESVRRFAGSTADAEALVSELSQIESKACLLSGTGGNDDGGGGDIGEASAVDSSGGSTRFNTHSIPRHLRAWSIDSNNSGSNPTQFLRRGITSDFGLSNTDLRSERLSQRPPELGSPNTAVEMSETTMESLAWKRDVAWQLETISEEINSIRRHYRIKEGETAVPLSQSAAQPAAHSAIGGQGTFGTTAPGNMASRRLRHVNRQASLASLASELPKIGDPRHNHDAYPGNNPTPSISTLWQIIVALTARGAQKLAGLATRSLKTTAAALSRAIKDAGGLILVLALLQLFTKLPASVQQLSPIYQLRLVIFNLIGTIVRGFGLEMVPVNRGIRYYA